MVRVHPNSASTNKVSPDTPAGARDLYAADSAGIFSPPACPSFGAILSGKNASGCAFRPGAQVRDISPELIAFRPPPAGLF